MDHFAASGPTASEVRATTAHRELRAEGGRLILLEGLRGVAAICVAAYHFGREAKTDVFTHAYLSVDFFFI